MGSSASHIPPFAAVITAAGSSGRFLSGRIEDVKKEYLSIDGHSVLYRAVKPFYEIPGLSAVIVTCPKGSEDEAAVALEDLMDIQTVPMLLVEGGATRTESVRNALKALEGMPASFGYIAIHDGERPYITKELIIRTLAAATVVGGAAPATRVVDALRTLGPDGMIESAVDKSGIIALQTPQIFRRESLIDAYASFDGSADDDIAVFINAGYKASAIQGDRKNRKITYLDDIPDAERQIEEYAKARLEGRRSAAASRRMRELIAEGSRE